MNTTVEKNMEPRPGEIVIEVDIEQHKKYYYTENFAVPPIKYSRIIVSGNGELEFRPAGSMNVRSRFTYKRSPGTRYEQEADMLDYIVGQYIHVDVERRIGRVSDPLGYPSFAENYKRLKAVGNRMQIPDWKFPEQIMCDAEYSLAEDEALWTWLYWMRRVVNQGCSAERSVEQEGEWKCRPIQNLHALPSLEEIVASRKVRILQNPESDPRLEQWLHDARKGERRAGVFNGPEPGYNAEEDRGFLREAMLSGSGI